MRKNFLSSFGAGSFLFSQINLRLDSPVAPPGYWPVAERAKALHKK